MTCPLPTGHSWGTIIPSTWLGPMPQTLLTPAERIFLLICGALLVALPSPRPAAGQSVDLQPGDSVRFVEVRTVAWQGDDGRVIRSSEERTPLSGTVIEVQRDSLRIRVAGTPILFGSSRLDDVEVWTDLANPRPRAFRQGAIVGGALLGGLALAFAFCNPGIFGDAGCQAPPSVADVATFSLKGAAIGAAVLGSVFFLLAPDSGWEAVDTPYMGLGVDGTATLGLRFPVFE